MNGQHSSTINMGHPDARSESEMRLHGSFLLLARIAWVALAGLSIGLMAVSLPSFFAYLHTVSATSFYGPQLTPGDVRKLHALGLSLDFYAWLNIGVFLILPLVCSFLGIILFLRRPDDLLALLASLSLMSYPIGFNSQVVGTLPPAWTLPTEIVTFFSSLCLGFFIFLFPSGQFAPRWTGVLMLAWIVNWINSDFFPNTAFNNSWFGAFPLVGLVASLIALQVYRYRRVSTPLERQQTKWVVFGIAVTFGGIVAFIFLVDFLLPQLFPMSPLSFFFWQIPFNLWLLLFPCSIAFAILRSHLWNIDTLINKTLVYGLLTGFLVAVYAGLTVGLESLVGLFTGQTSQPVAIVVSTLAIAALFQPLRSRLQQVIDRRFYRSKYDAARALEAFNATLRNEVDLATLSQHLLAVVQETMQPASVSLWLRPLEGQQKAKEE